MEDYIGRDEHEEFCRRMEDEHKRINHRIGTLEETVREIGALTASVQRLAQSVESMAKTQTKQETRLETLEGRDGEKWRTAMGYIATLLIGAVFSLIVTQIGL